MSITIRPFKPCVLRVLISFVLVAGLAIVSPSLLQILTQEDRRQYMECSRKSGNAWWHNDFPEAERIWRNELKSHTNNPNLFQQALDKNAEFELGKALYMKARTYNTPLSPEIEPLYKDALRFVEAFTWLGLDKESTEIQRSMAMLYVDQHRYAEAESLYRMMLSRSINSDCDVSTHLDYHVYPLADLYESQKQYPNAEKVLNEAEQFCFSHHIDPAETIERLALLYDRQGAYVKAMNAFEKALKNVEKNETGRDKTVLTAKILGNLGRTYLRLGEIVKAKNALTKAKELNVKEASEAWDDHRIPRWPAIGPILISLAEVYEIENRSTEAEMLYKREIEVDELAIQRKECPASERTDFLRNIALSKAALAKMSQRRH